MEKILINDLLQLTETEIDNCRLKLNVFNGNTDPLEEYKRDPDKINVNWFLWHNQRRRYFKEGQIAICLLYLYDDKWLLTTIKKITKELDVVDNIGFEAEEIPEFKKYYGRLVLKYHNTERGMGRKYSSMMEKLEVIEILSTTYDGDDFPGYENIRLSFTQLETIIDKKRSGWIEALGNQKAVYLITDISNGKMYVGSATAQDGIRCLNDDEFENLENEIKKLDERVYQLREEEGKLREVEEVISREKEVTSQYKIDLDKAKSLLQERIKNTQNSKIIFLML